MYTDAYDIPVSADNDVDFCGEACTHAVVLRNGFGENMLYLVSFLH